MDEKIKNELQSATFNRLIEHLRERKDVQNIDLMNLAGFCRFPVVYERTSSSVWRWGPLIEFCDYLGSTIRARVPHALQGVRFRFVEQVTECW